jgi:diguanylate cyclase (GGDEF)-like protein
MMKSRHAKLAAALVGQRSALAAKAGTALGEGPGRPGDPARELMLRMRTAVVELAAEAQALRNELEQARAKIARLETLADRDVLTPVLNRRAFLRELARVLSFGARYGQAGGLLYFDVCDLKRINDQLGHAAGDAALVHVAGTLVRRVRDSDIVGRLGGDEFGVVLVQGEGAIAAAKARELARAVRAGPALFQGRRLRVRVACGVHDLAADEAAAEALAAADRAMYRDKK